MINFNNQIENIKKEIFEYYEMSFETAADDYLHNKQLKLKLKDVIIKNKDNKQIVEKALLVLAEVTGCAEDHEIAEEILDDLFGKVIIDKTQLDVYYSNVAAGRWL